MAEEEREPACLPGGQTRGIREGFLKETTPGLDLERKVQVSHRKKTLGSEEDFVDRGSSMCKGAKALIFQSIMVAGL